MNSDEIGFALLSFGVIVLSFTAIGLVLDDVRMLDNVRMLSKRVDQLQSEINRLREKQL